MFLQFKSSSDEIINSKFKCVFLSNTNADSTRHGTKEFLSTNMTDAICSGENVTNQHNNSDHETAFLHSTSNNDPTKARITFFESSNQSESNNDDTNASPTGLNQVYYNYLINNY